MPPRRKRYLDNAAPADNTTNVVQLVNRMIQVKQKDTLARKEKETREYKARQERAKYTPANLRQASIGPYREKTALDKQGGRLYAAGEQRRKDAEDREAAGVVLNSLVKPILPSTYVDMVAAIKNGRVNSLTDALAAPYLSDSWSQRNPGKALVADIAAPFVLNKAKNLIRFTTNSKANPRNAVLFTENTIGINPDNYDNFMQAIDKAGAESFVSGWSQAPRKEYPERVIQEMLGTVIPRLKRNHVSDSEISKVINKIENLNYQTIPRKLYSVAGRPNVLGTQNPITDNIAINDILNLPGWLIHKRRTLGHEGRHAIDHVLSNDLKHSHLFVLKRTYGDDLYDDIREFPTINYDVRHALFNRHLVDNGEDLFTADLAKQNAYIDNATNGDILRAIANSNGYGKRYVDKLLKDLDKTNPVHRKYISDKVAGIKDALKYVPGLVLPVALINNK